MSCPDVEACRLCPPKKEGRPPPVGEVTPAPRLELGFNVVDPAIDGMEGGPDDEGWDIDDAIE